MAMKGNQGISSKNVVRPGVRTGSGSFNARPAGAAQIGLMVGDHATSGGSSGYTGEKLHGPAERNMQPVPFGNELALNVGKGGPGAGRTVYHCGSQDVHGATTGSPRPAGRGILTNE
jgi:hypothetical protein